MYKIYFLKNDELTNYESLNKGYRNDVFFKDKIFLYRLKIYDLIRIVQDAELEIQEYGFYDIETNLILVNEVNEEEIVNTIKELFKQGYFNKIKSFEEPFPEMILINEFNDADIDCFPVSR